VTVALIYSVDARRMLDEIDERWIAQHGLSEANPLLDEVQDAATRLRANPQLGRIVPARKQIRRVLLRSGWHLYYRYSADLIEIIAVWHASRSNRPPL